MLQRDPLRDVYFDMEHHAALEAGTAPARALESRSVERAIADADTRGPPPNDALPTSIRSKLHRVKRESLTDSPCTVRPEKPASIRSSPSMVRKSESRIFVRPAARAVATNGPSSTRPRRLNRSQNGTGRPYPLQVCALAPGETTHSCVGPGRPWRFLCCLSARRRQTPGRRSARRASSAPRSPPITSAAPTRAPSGGGCEESIAIGCLV